MLPSPEVAADAAARHWEVPADSFRRVLSAPSPSAPALPSPEFLASLAPVATKRLAPPEAVAPPGAAPPGVETPARARAPSPAVTPAAVLAPSPQAVAEAAARYREALAYADSIILGRPMRAPAAPRFTPAEAPASPAAQATPNDEGPPTFQVTIGQLEVVAPPPVEKVPRRRRPAPRLSLQEYLDRRRVGRL
jgi:hypothetical protein